MLKFIAILLAIPAGGALMGLFIGFIFYAVAAATGGVTGAGSVALWMIRSAEIGAIAWPIMLILS